MQRQQQKAKSSQKLSLGRSLAAVLLLLWGLLVSVAVTRLEFSEGVEGKVSQLCITLHGICCLLSGLAPLLRARRLSPFLLNAASLALIVILICGVWFGMQRNHGLPLLYLLGALAVLLVIVVGLFLLGRWLGQQEDLED